MEKCSGGPGLSTGDGEVKRALLGVHNNPLFTTYISVSKVEGVSSPPFRTIFFPEATCGHRAGRRGRRLLQEKRGLLDWFITKVAPSGSRFAEAGEASGHSLYAKTQARQESNKHAYMYSIKGHLYRSRRTDFSVIPLLRG